MNQSIINQPKFKVPNNQIRLLVPQSLFDDLTLIARAKFISRLCLIRSYLKDAIQKDLNQLRQQVAQIDATSKAKRAISERLDRTDEVDAEKSKKPWWTTY